MSGVFLFLEGLDRSTDKREFSVDVFSQSFHTQVRSLSSSVRKQYPSPFPSGLFFACHKTFSIKAVQTSPIARSGGFCVDVSSSKAFNPRLFGIPYF